MTIAAMTAMMPTTSDATALPLLLDSEVGATCESSGEPVDRVAMTYFSSLLVDGVLRCALAREGPADGEGDDRRQYGGGHDPGRDVARRGDDDPVVERVQGDARQQGTRHPVQEAGAEAEEGQRREDLRRVRHHVRGAEQERGDD